MHQKIVVFQVVGPLWPGYPPPHTLLISRLLLFENNKVCLKVSVDELSEKIEAFEDYVQSVDVAAMNKI